MERYRKLFRTGWQAMVLILLASAAVAQQAPVTIEMITWDVVGLDSNDTSAGNNLYLAGARVCNTSGVDLTNVQAEFVWDSVNLLINVQNNTNTLSEPVLAANSCFDFYFNIVVTRTALAYDTSRDYHIEVTADGYPTPVSNASENRQIYVESLVGQNRNKNLAITGPPTAYVGGIFQFTMQAETATPYEQVQTFIVFPNNVFQVISSETTYSQVKDGASAMVDSVYNDACGWVTDQTSPSYNSCSGSGKAGGIITQTYLVKIVDFPTNGSSTITLNGIIYDYSGSSFHYNSNYNSPGSSTWDIQVTPTPTSVGLSEVSASRNGSDVSISWNSSFEAGNLGYHVWRELDGVRERLTPSLIAGSAFVGGALALGGSSYQWTDTVAIGSQPAYWIESFGLDGVRQVSESVRPLAASAEPGGRRRSTVVRDLPVQDDRALRRIGGTVRASSNSMVMSARANDASGVASSDALKIWIEEDGWYRVPAEELFAAGFDATRAQKLRLLNRGTEIPMLVEDGGDRSFDAGDAVYFYAESLETPYTDENVYWIVSDPKPGARMLLESPRKAAPLQSSSFPYTVERKDRFLHFAALDNGPEGDNWFGPFLASVWNMNVTQQLDLRHLDPSGGMATLELVMQGAEDRLGDQQDHQIRISVNGAHVGVMVFDGWEHASQTFEFPASLLREGRNDVLLVSQSEIWDRSVVDRVRLTYPHRWIADEGRELRFVAPSGSRVTVSGFNSDRLTAIDVTDPSAPFLVPVQAQIEGGAWTAKVDLAGTGDRLVYVLSDAATKKPADLRPNLASNWADRGNAADLVIIGHASLLDAAAPLADARRAQGYAVEVIDVEDLFDEFADGIRTPHAIRDFFTFAHQEWSRQPRFAIFVGDATADPNDYTGHGFGDFVPTRMLMTAFSKTASDDWFTDLDGDGGAEIPIGRLPARDTAEAATMVGKILAYENRVGSEWSRQALLVTDRNDPGGITNNFMAVSDSANHGLPAALETEKIYADIDGILNARTRLKQRWNEGVGLVNYYGHGTAQAWSRYNLFTRNDARALQNGDRLPIVTAMTCLLSFFHDPNSESFGESLLRNPSGGAVAVWGSSGLTYLDRQVEMNDEFMRLFYHQGLTLGEAIVRAKRATSSRDVRQTWILFGDPTLTFAAQR